MSFPGDFKSAHGFCNRLASFKTTAVHQFDPGADVIVGSLYINVRDLAHVASVDRPLDAPSF
jgi:hypothetical protein